MKTEIADQVREKVVADHVAAMGRVHWCRFVIGYVDDSDEQTEIDLNPPVLVVVDGPSSPDQGLFHDTGTHMDPYWDISFIKPVDPRVVHLRSCYTYGPSYSMETGEVELRDKVRPTIWLTSARERFVAFLRRFPLMS